MSDELEVIDDDILDNADDSVIEDESESQEEKDKAEEEDDLESYGKRVQKRINKLHYKHAVAEEQWRKENEELRKKIEEIESRQVQQFQEKDNESLEQKRKELMKRRKDALEIGDYEEINSIDDELIEIKLQSKYKAEPPRQEPQRQPPERQPESNNAMATWQQKNQWVFDQSQKSRLDKANGVLQKLLDQGYDLEDEETFAELDKRLKREAPPTVGAPDRGQVTGDKNAFTVEDKKMMLEFGLNPNDAQARKLWIKNRG